MARRFDHGNQGYRQDNPAGGAVTAALPKQGGDRKHLRTPHHDVADAIREVRRSKAYATVRLAAEFATLTAARSGEVLGVQWEEINLDTRLWTIPGGRECRDRMNIHYCNTRHPSNEEDY